jgi:hypothetical protein
MVAFCHFTVDSIQWWHNRSQYLTLNLEDSILRTISTTNTSESCMRGRDKQRWQRIIVQHDKTIEICESK